MSLEPHQEANRQPRSDQQAADAMPKLPKGYDPIENAMRQHPGLTRAEAEEMAEAFGF